LNRIETEEERREPQERIDFTIWKRTARGVVVAEEWGGNTRSYYVAMD
jgi:hypothetical protein